MATKSMTEYDEVMHMISCMSRYVQYLHAILVFFSNMIFMTINMCKRVHTHTYLHISMYIRVHSYLHAYIRKHADLSATHT